MALANSLLCHSCGDQVPQAFEHNSLIIHPKCHCRQCYLEIVWKIVEPGRPIKTGYTAGGGRRLMRNEKASGG